MMKLASTRQLVWEQIANRNSVAVRAGNVAPRSAFGHVGLDGRLCNLMRRNDDLRYP
jgi:hypothetical protein